METHFISTHHLSTQLGNHLTINGDNTSLDELVGLAAAANTCIGKELVQTDRLIGIEVLLLIFYTLLQAILGMRIIAGGMLAIAATLLTIATALLTVTAALLVATLTGLIAALLTIAAALLVTTLTRLVAAFLIIIIVARTIAVLRTLTVTATLLIATLTRLITTLLTIAATGLITTLTRLVAAFLIIVVGTRTIAATLRGIRLQTCTETFRTESTLFLILVTIVATLIAVRPWLMNTRTW